MNVIASLHAQWKLVYCLDDAENSFNWKLQNHITFHYSICWQHTVPIAKVQKSKPVYERLYRSKIYTYSFHMLHNAHEYGPMETAMTLLHSTQKRKCMNTLENCYIHYFHQHNVIIKEKTKKRKFLIWNNLWYIIPPRKCVISPTINPTPNHSTPHVTSLFQLVQSSDHQHAGKYLINYPFTFHSIPLISDALPYSYTYITLL